MRRWLIAAVALNLACQRPQAGAIVGDSIPSVSGAIEEMPGQMEERIPLQPFSIPSHPADAIFIQQEVTICATPGAFRAQP